MLIETGIHGVNTVAEYVGFGKLLNVDGVGWSDITGLRKGWGITYRGVARSSNWFHLAVPTIIATSATNSSPNLMDLKSIIINFQTFGSAYLRSVHIWIGAQRIFVRDNLRVVGDYRDRIVQNENVFIVNYHALEPGMNVGISMGVEFGSSDSNILFQGAGASFGG